MTVDDEYLEEVPVEDVKIGDVLFGTHEVTGFGRANQRGRDALRLDLELLDEYATDEPSARLILPLDHVINVRRAVAYHSG